MSWDEFKNVGKPKPIPAAPEPAQADTEFVRWGAELQRALAQSVGGVMLRGSRAVPVGTAPSGTMRPASGHADALVGFALRNPSSTTETVVTFYDGHNANGNYLFEVSLAAGESSREWWGAGGGVALTRGLFLSDSAGLMSGSVFLRGSDY